MGLKIKSHQSRATEKFRNVQLPMYFQWNFKLRDREEE